jgi:hypothetical protein
MNLVKTAALVNATPLVVPVGDMEFPVTVTLSSADGGRLIELSTNGGVAGGWFTPTYDVTIAGMINIGLVSPVSHVRFTGAAADVWRVQ